MLLAFGGGVLLQDTLAKVSLPQVKRASDGATSFRLSVRAVSASVPALCKPGLLSQRRPRLEVSLGDVHKDTELADYVEEDESSPEAGERAHECPWRFGDTLTFVASVKDVLSGDLRFRLRAHSEVFLGPVQLQLQSVAELGEGSCNIRQRVLPACVRDRHLCNGMASSLWESPMLPVPLSHVKGGVVSADHGLGEAVAHVTVVFKLDRDPEALMELADDQVRPVSDVINRRANSVMRWAFEQPLEQPSSRVGWSSDDEGDEVPEDRATWEPRRDAANIRSISLCNFCLDHSGKELLGDEEEFDLMKQTLTGAEIQQAVEKANSRRQCAAPPASTAITAPDLAPDGWVSRRGPNGRLYWHHRSLGPAPWEQEPTGVVIPKMVASPSWEHLRPVASAHLSPPTWEPCGALPPPRCNPAWGAATARPAAGIPIMRTAEGPPRPVVSGAMRRADGAGPIVSPTLPDDGWVSQIGPGGRTFWHNRSLGPAPWEVPQQPRGDTFLMTRFSQPSTTKRLMQQSI